MKGICFVCGKRLTDAVGREVDGVPRMIDGNPVRMHKSCSQSHDSESRSVTARATTNEDGRVYLHDEQRWSRESGLVRVVHPHHGSSE